MNIFFKSIIFFIFFTFLFLFFAVKSYADISCANVQVYIVNADNPSQGVPGAKTKLKCSRGGICDEDGHWDQACWENSGWKDVPGDGHVYFNRSGTNLQGESSTDKGYDCDKGNAKWEVSGIPSGWTWQCTTSRDYNSCPSQGFSNIDSNNLPVINGGDYVFKVFYKSPIPVFTPTSTPTVTPTRIPTSTPTITPTITPTRTPGTPTATPGPTATPTPTARPGSPTATPTPTSLPGAASTPTPTSTPANTPTPTLSPTPTPLPFSENMCKCDGLESSMISPGMKGTFTAYAKVEGSDVNSAKIDGIEFNLGEEKDLSNPNNVTRLEGPVLVSTQVIESTSSKVRYKSVWEYKMPQSLSNNAYRVWANIKCSRKTIAMGDNPIRAVLGAGIKEGSNFISDIFTFFSKVLGAAISSNKTLQLKTFNTASIIQNACSIIRFKF